jgi:hypothetical protein
VLRKLVSIEEFVLQPSVIEESSLDVKCLGVLGCLVSPRYVLLVVDRSMLREQLVLFL